MDNNELNLLLITCYSKVMSFKTGFLSINSQFKSVNAKIPKQFSVTLQCINEIKYNEIEKVKHTSGLRACSAVI